MKKEKKTTIVTSGNKTKGFFWAAVKLSLSALLFSSAVLPAFSDTFQEAFNRGKNLQSMGDEEGAINNYVLAESLAPNAFNDARLCLARLYAKLGRYNEADSEWQQMLTNTQEIKLKYEYGNFLVNQGRFNSAMSVWSDILSQSPNDPTALYYMGLCLEGTDNMDSAQEYYRKVVSIAPNTAAGVQAAGKLSRLGQATDMKTANKMFPVDPENGEAGLGWWNLQKMPIHVYVDDGTGTIGYRTEMKNYVFRALEAWRQASGGKITFVMDPPDLRGEAGWRDVFGKDTDPLRRTMYTRKLPDDPVKTGIHVHWVPTLGGVALGLAWTNVYANKADANGFKDCTIRYGHIWLNTNSMADGTPLPKNITAANSSILDKQDRIMSEVTVHEFGHTLGLLHSPNPKDVMCSGIFAMNSTDLVEGRTLSMGDVGSLSEHYNHFEGTGFPAETVANAKKLLATAILGEGARTGAGVGAVTVPASPTDSGRSYLLPTDEILHPVPKIITEMNDVVFDINTKHYTDAQSKLDKILKEEPGNSSAHYLRGVVCVMMKDYRVATTEYQQVVKLSPGTELAKRATDGLEKIKQKQ